MAHYELAAIAADIRTRAGDVPVTVVAVDGPSGGGKSRLAKRIARALGEHVVVHVDDLVPGWDGLPEVSGVLRPLLEALRAGRSGTYRAWDWIADRPGEPREVAAAPYVVVEGCGAGAADLADLVTYLVWVDVPADVRRSRARQRDDPQVHAHWDRWAAHEAAHYERHRTRERADLVVDGRLPVR